MNALRRLPLWVLLTAAVSLATLGALGYANDVAHHRPLLGTATWLTVALAMLALGAAVSRIENGPK